MNETFSAYSDIAFKMRNYYKGTYWTAMNRGNTVAYMDNEAQEWRFIVGIHVTGWWMYEFDAVIYADAPTPYSMTKTPNDGWVDHRYTFDANPSEGKCINDANGKMSLMYGFYFNPLGFEFQQGCWYMDAFYCGWFTDSISSECSWEAASFKT